MKLCQTGRTKTQNDGASKLQVINTSMMGLVTSYQMLLEVAMRSTEQELWEFVETARKEFLVIFHQNKLPSLEVVVYFNTKTRQTFTQSNTPIIVLSSLQSSTAERISI